MDWAGLAFWISLCVAFAYFIDLILGSRRNRKIKRRLLNINSLIRDRRYRFIGLWVMERVSLMLGVILAPDQEDALLTKRGLLRSCVLSLTCNFVYATTKNLVRYPHHHVRACDIVVWTRSGFMRAHSRSISFFDCGLKEAYGRISVAGCGFRFIIFSLCAYLSARCDLCLILDAAGDNGPRVEVLRDKARLSGI